MLFELPNVAFAPLLG